MNLQSGRLKGQAVDEATVWKGRLLMKLHSGRLKGHGADEVTVWKAERTWC